MLSSDTYKSKRRFVTKIVVCILIVTVVFFVIMHVFTIICCAILAYVSNAKFSLQEYFLTAGYLKSLIGSFMASTLFVLAAARPFRINKNRKEVELE